MSDAAEDNQQFEQVLSRLDALMKRSHSGAPPEPEAPGAEQAPAADAPAGGSTPAFVILEELTEIPVLTEVYAGETTPVTPPEQARHAASAEEVIAALMPVILENLDLIVAEEAARMQQALADRLRSEISQTLHRRLQGKDS